MAMWCCVAEYGVADPGKDGKGQLKMGIGFANLYLPIKISLKTSARIHDQLAETVLCLTPSGTVKLGGVEPIFGTSASSTCARNGLADYR